MNDIGISVEGESDKKVLEEIIGKLGLDAYVDVILLPRAGGKTEQLKHLEKIIFGKLRNYRKVIILVDYDDSKEWENKFKSKTGDLKNKPGAKNKEIILHFARQKIEAWLLGCYPKDILKDVASEDTDEVIDPVSLIENFEKKERNDKDFRYIKTADGKRIAERNELKHFRDSKSFREFEKILKIINN